MWLDSLLSALPDVRFRVNMKAPHTMVKGVHVDSRRVVPGSVFVAVRGTHQDGRRFIADALDRGAVAIVADEPPDEGIAPGMPFVLVDDARAAAGRLADRFFGEPSASVATIGVTGTNGKTTTAWLVATILGHAGDRPGMLGTIGLRTPARNEKAGTTTPDPVTIHEALAEVRDGGGRTAVMEVSSHALDQRRAAGVRFGTAIFTNLTGDHLDYHGDMDGYAAAKRRLFELLPASGLAVINARDPRALEMARASAAPIVFFGIEGEAPADPAIRPAVTARIIRRSLEGTLFTLCLKDGGVEVPVQLPLVGRHNVENALAAVAAARRAGVAVEQIVDGLQRASTVPGRLERVSPPGGPAVLVDYAHTDDALSRVLQAVRPLATGKLAVVFGCGGDRDRTKRPRMAAVAERFADVAIVTSDNPRGEDPEAIIADVCAGFCDPARHVTEVDRAAAIRRGVREVTGPGDVLLIAGKGHEDYQLIGGRTIAFDDRREARRAMAEAWDGQAPEVAIRAASDQFRSRSAAG